MLSPILPLLLQFQLLLLLLSLLSRSPMLRTFLTDHQLELGIRALQAAQLLEQDPSFWLMQGLITANSFGCYRLELAVDLTEEGDRMVHQLAGLGD